MPGLQLSAANNAWWFIATQAPLKETVLDFWQMVWEQEVDVIAMLTAFEVVVFFIVFDVAVSFSYRFKDSGFLDVFSCVDLLTTLIYDMVESIENCGK